MKTYLVTGGCGFIGTNFIRYILNNFNDVKIINADCLTYAANPDNLNCFKNDKNYVFYKADICDQNEISRIFAENDIDYVVNFAAESHVDRSILNPDSFVRTNVLGTVNLLRVAKESWKTGEDEYKSKVKFIQVSTDEVYGSLGSEGLFNENTPLDPHSPYSASKASADLFVKAFFDTYKLPVNITRCSNNYGPFQFPEKLIPLTLNNVLNHKDVPIYGDGLQVRDWIFVEDHCKAILAVINGGKAGEVYNIGSHNEKTNLFIVKSIIKYIKENVDTTVGEHLIKHITDRKGHDRRYAIDPEKIKTELGWNAETSFEEGIRKTVEWYINNWEWLKNTVSGEYLKYYEKMYNGKKKI